MTDRDRLIELLKNYPCMSTAEDCFMESIAKNLTDYLLANGVIVPPAPIGSTVYVIRARGVKEFGKQKGRKYDYSPDTLYSLRGAASKNGVLYIAPKKYCKSDKARLNKTVFLTKEGAEEKLKELEKDAN